MGEKKGINPLLVGLGLAAGAAGAIFLSKKENRDKAKKALNKAKNSSGSWLSQAAGFLQEAANDMQALTGEKSLDKEKKRRKK